MTNETKTEKKTFSSKEFPNKIIEGMGEIIDQYLDILFKDILGENRLFTATPTANKIIQQWHKSQREHILGSLAEFKTKKKVFSGLTKEGLNNYSIHVINYNGIYISIAYTCMCADENHYCLIAIDENAEVWN